ncbi:MAG TPA: poly-gamma-glutamate hydrolase family protein [Candidatus Obscuribacterales bacterium]
MVYPHPGKDEGANSAGFRSSRLGAGQSRQAVADKYSSVLAIKQRFADGRDYRIRYTDRSSWATIISPHGGYIEPGTSAVARAIAGSTYNFFDFQALRRESAQEFHVTATKFRDPALSKLLETSMVALSVHCMGRHGSPVIWLGGLNRRLKELTLAALKEGGFAVDPDAPRYKGESPQNIVNLPARQGVQLELSAELLSSLFAGKSCFYPSGRCPRTSSRFTELVSAVRSALHQYEPTALQPPGAVHVPGKGN